MFLDIFPEKRRVGESEEVTHLLYAIVGLFQVVTDILLHLFRNPLVGSLPRLLFADEGEVFGRYTEFVGIVLNRSVLHLTGMEQIEESLEMATAGLSV